MPEMYPGFVCLGCGKHITGHSYPPERCHDCMGTFAKATASRLACDRCGDEDAGRVLGPTDHNRLCQSCIDAVNQTVEDDV